MTPPAVPGTGGPSKDAAGDVSRSGIDGSMVDRAMYAENAADSGRDPAMGSGVSKTREVIDEFRSVVLGQGRILDAAAAVGGLPHHQGAGGRSACHAGRAVDRRIDLAVQGRPSPALADRDPRAAGISPGIRRGAVLPADRAVLPPRHDHQRRAGGRVPRLGCRSPASGRVDEPSRATLAATSGTGTPVFSRPTAKRRWPGRCSSCCRQRFSGPWSSGRMSA